MCCSRSLICFQRSRSWSDGSLDLSQAGFASCSPLKAAKLFGVKLQESRHNFLWPKDIVCIITVHSLNLVLLHSHFSSLILAKPAGRRMAGTWGCLSQVHFPSFIVLPFPYTWEQTMSLMKPNLVAEVTTVSFNSCIIFHRSLLRADPGDSGFLSTFTASIPSKSPGGRARKESASVGQLGRRPCP